MSQILKVSSIISNNPNVPLLPVNHYQICDNISLLHRDRWNEQFVPDRTIKKTMKKSHRYTPITHLL